MITEPTVLILGAGASSPYGFPLGWELTDRISKMRDRTIDFGHLSDFFGYHRSGSIRQFVERFAKSEFSSIDKFLSLSGLPEDYLSFGKAAIGICLCDLEDPAKLSSRDGWYTALWNAIGPLDPSDLAKNKLSILTFNYDRSIECYLNRQTCATFNCDPATAAKYLEHIKVVHLYGSLGLYQPGHIEHREYRPRADAAGLTEAIATLRVIPEHREDEIGTFEIGRELLSGASRIMFLGFSFDDLNLDRLKLSQALRPERQHGTQIAMSTYNMTPAEVWSARQTALGKFNSWKVAISAAKCEQAIRDVGIFQRHMIWPAT